MSFEELSVCLKTLLSKAPLSYEWSLYDQDDRLILMFSHSDKLSNTSCLTFNFEVLILEILEI